MPKSIAKFSDFAQRITQSETSAIGHSIWDCRIQPGTVKILSSDYSGNIPCLPVISAFRRIWQS